MKEPEPPYLYVFFERQLAIFLCRQRLSLAYSYSMTLTYPPLSCTVAKITPVSLAPHFRQVGLTPTFIRAGISVVLVL